MPVQLSIKHPPPKFLQKYTFAQTKTCRAARLFQAHKVTQRYGLP